MPAWRSATGRVSSAYTLPEHGVEDPARTSVEIWRLGEAVLSELVTSDQPVAQLGDAHDLSSGDHAHAQRPYAGGARQFPRSLRA